jgi:hypothetical protein
LYFPGEGKNFPGGNNLLFAEKQQQKDNIFLKKSQKTNYFWPALAGRGGQGPHPPDALGLNEENPTF